MCSISLYQSIKIILYSTKQGTQVFPIALSLNKILWLFLPCTLVFLSLLFLKICLRSLCILPLNFYIPTCHFFVFIFVYILHISICICTPLIYELIIIMASVADHCEPGLSNCNIDSDKISVLINFVFIGTSIFLYHDVLIICIILILFPGPFYLFLSYFFLSDYMVSGHKFFTNASPSLLKFPLQNIITIMYNKMAESPGEENGYPLRYP